MQRLDYYADAHVQGFARWMTPILTGERRFQHRWSSPKWGEWSCTSLFDAYQRFRWPFTTTQPGERQPKRKQTFEENVEELAWLGDVLKDSAQNQDADAFFGAALAVVDWGGVRRNRPRLEMLRAAPDGLQTILAARDQLDPMKADLTRLDAVRDMNSGFSKIYSLLLDGFPIYDSRVAAALASLVRFYSEEQGLAEVPAALQLGLPLPRRSSSRDPSAGTLRFPHLRPSQRTRYAISNVKAAWLLGLLADLGCFGQEPRERRLLALQSALFMIGYAVPDHSALDERPGSA